MTNSPESPRWLVHQGYYEEARLSVAQTNSNGDLSDPVTIAVYKEILDTIRWEKEQGRSMSPMELIKTPVARKRFLIGMSPGPFSCIAGNIIASYYLGSELDTAGVTNANDQLIAVRISQFLLFSGDSTTDAEARTSFSISGASLAVLLGLSSRRYGVVNRPHCSRKRC
jgi:hypothetical protein